MLLSGFVKAYMKYPQSKLMFKQVSNSVVNLKADTYTSTLEKAICDLQTLLKELSLKCLPSLVKNTKKPKVLRQYEPSFCTVTVGRSQRELPAERREEQKLLHKYKKEFKGAVKELRRDRVFLANVKLKERYLSDKQRARKVKEIINSVAAQERDEKKERKN